MTPRQCKFIGIFDPGIWEFFKIWRKKKAKGIQLFTIKMHFCLLMINNFAHAHLKISISGKPYFWLFKGGNSTLWLYKSHNSLPVQIPVIHSTYQRSFINQFSDGPELLPKHLILGLQTYYIQYKIHVQILMETHHRYTVRK